MADRPGAGAPSLWRLILIPSVITLAVTLLRLWGELKHWPAVLFNPAAGGAAAVVGITWLVPVLGVYFALKLARGTGDARAARVIAVAVLALVVVFAVNAAVAAIKGEQTSQAIIGVFAVSSVLGGLVGLAAWPALGRILLAYGFAARVPVALLMLAAIRGDWGTHYDAPPPGFPAMRWLGRWFWTGLLPQMTIWTAFTVIVGTLAGGLTLLVVEGRGGRRPARPAVPPVPRGAGLRTAARPRAGRTG